MLSILTGFAAGGLHVFSGVDHLAALSPIAMENPSRAGRIGAYWGFGHGIGVVAVGSLGLLLRSFVDVDAWSAWAEFLVGFLLIGVGVWAMVRAGRTEVHDHTHSHDSSAHTHAHAHDPGDRSHVHAALGVGIFHGMAGSGHLFGVLPALALPTLEAVAYLAAYLVAASAAMSLYAYGLGVLAKQSGPVGVKRLMFGSGAIAVVVGVLWIVNARPF